MYVEILGTRFPIPSPFRLPMYYHYLTQTLKLFDQWADEQSNCAPALRDPLPIAELARQLDAQALQQMVADINRYFIPAMTGLKGQFAALPQADFLQYCYFRFCLQEREAPELWAGKNFGTYQKDFVRHQQNQFADLPCFFSIDEATLHPLTLLTLRHLSESLWNNVARACRHFSRMRSDLGVYFFGGDTPVQLLRMQAPDPRRMKGGGRALILHLYLSSGKLGALIYKPFDLERSFLIAGDHAFAWDLLERGLLQDEEVKKSLNWLKRKTMGGACLLDVMKDLGACLPPSFKILPCRPGSSLAEDENGRLPQIRESYGFMEASWTEGGEQNWIQNDSNKLAAFAALTQTFGVEACEQILASPNHSHLTGLDHQCFGLMSSLVETGLLEIQCRPYYKENLEPIVTGGYSGLNICQSPKPLEDTEEELVLGSASQSNFEAAYLETMTLIARNGATLLQWAAGLRGVVVRVFPYPDAMLEWEVCLRHHNSMRYAKDGSRHLQDVPNYASALEALARDEAALWSSENENYLKTHPQPDTVDPQKKDQLFARLQPAFSVYQSRSLLLDAVRGDLPTFYHRLGSRELMGSDGSIIRFALQCIESPLVSRALTALYGNDWQTACPYFPRESMAVVVEHIRRLAEDETYFHSVTAASIAVLDRRAVCEMDNS